MTLSMERRTVITGMGAIAATGTGTETYWEATREGRSGIAEISRFDSARYPVRLAGEVRDFDAADHVDPRLIVQTDLWTHFALAASSMAIDDAGLGPDEYEDPSAIGVTTSSSTGGNAFGQREIEALWARGPKQVGPYQSIAWFYAASTGQLSIANGFKGPCGVIVTESAGGLDAIAHARRVIRRGGKVHVVGGTEAPVGPYVLSCQINSGLLTRRTNPARAYVPFTDEAAGYLPGEGGAMLVLEEGEQAERRGATAHAEILGHGAAFRGRAPANSSDRDGWRQTREPLERAIDIALADAKVNSHEIDVAFADGLGIPEADEAEAVALRSTLGARASSVPVALPKTGVGRLYSGGAALDVVTAALALRDGVVPPAPGLDSIAPHYGLDVVTENARELPLEHALVVARGYGGFAAALVLRRLQSTATRQQNGRRG